MGQGKGAAMTDKLSERLEEQTRQFWLALDQEQEWFVEPYLAEYGPDVFVMQTKPGFIFDDSFWEIFQQFSFRICHVAYYGPERLLEEDRHEDTGMFELRWAAEERT
jgi:hypothetical protein